MGIVRRATPLAATALTLALIPSSALAQQTQSSGAAAPNSDAVGDMIRRGLELRRQGQDQQAYELINRAYQAQPTPRVEAQLGLVEQALGRWLDADTHLRHALSMSDDPWIRTNRGALESSLQIVSQRVGRLEVMSNATGAELYIDGRRMGSLPMSEPLRVLSGTVVVEVRAPNFVSVQRSIVVTPGGLARESIQLVEQSSGGNVSVGGSGSVQTPGGSGSTGGSGPIDTPRYDRRPLHPAVFFTGAAITAVLGGVLIWSGVDTLSYLPEYTNNPTEENFNIGFARQSRTNYLIIATSVTALATGVIGIFATRWGTAPPSSSARDVRRTWVPLLGASPQGATVGLGGSF